MNPICFRFLLIACSVVCAAGASDIPPERMRAIYEEVKTPYKYGIVIPAPEGKKVDCPTVFRHGDRWYMVYVQLENEPQGYTTQLAVSDDLLHWQTRGTILARGDGDAWDRANAAGGIALVDTKWASDGTLDTREGRYWISYLGGAHPGYETPPLCISMASTLDPTSTAGWEKQPAPVLRPDDKDARPFETGTLFKSFVFRDAGATLGAPFVMYYNARPPRGDETIGIAVSQDMRTWRRYSDEPVIVNPRPPDLKHGVISGDPQVVRMDDLWVMFYFGAFWKPKAFDTFAASRDLVHWTRWDGPHLIEPSEPWDDEFAHKPWLLKHNGVVYHFYCAVGNQGRAIALATSRPMKEAGRGNRIPDFSNCGYMAAERPIPDVPIRIVVPAVPGDATQRIQRALDYVAAMPADSNGIRGAVLLEAGIHRVSGSLKIAASGLVLRGTGMGQGGTVLLGTGQHRDTLICIKGRNDRKMGSPVAITDAFVPVNANAFRVDASHSFHSGDQVLVHRPSTKEWIQALDTDHFGGGITNLGWKPGSRDLYWDRTIVSIDGDRVTLDVPLTTALDAAYGGGSVAVYQWPGRIAQVGIENLCCRSTYDEDNPKDEAHRWMAVTLENVSDVWVRQVMFEHFAGSAVAALETAKRVTVEDCKSLAPVSEIGGQRRNTFWTMGQQTLFQRLYAECGYHDFAIGFCAAGPNAFVQCESSRPFSFSGGIDSWASGVLFDIVNIDGHALSLFNRSQDAQGAGWNAANSVLWQCSASRIDCYSPPTACNWAFGSWAEFSGNGYWQESNSHVQPRSLYYAQLQDRLGERIRSRMHLLPVSTEASSSPSPEQAAALTAQSGNPPRLLCGWIDQTPQRQPIPTAHGDVKTIDQIEAGQARGPAPTSLLHIENGWLVYGDAVMTGKRLGVQWWSGGIRPPDVARATPHITRFVPGRSGTGLTDDLDEVTDGMQGRGQVALEHNYGLWYERRRDDHERVRRMDGDVWPPFYELPFARSGQGTAFDGLSRYDLTKYNPWYWMRLRQFADLAGRKGLVLIHQNYFQHNVIEAGAHWTDFSWRPANNINDTGFPEPPPYAGDKRIFLAEQFYDVNHPARRPLHRAYIRQCLNNFADNSSVIQFIGTEYTGPLHFVQFWIDTILEWERETGKHAVVGLSVTKDVQDAVLADPIRGPAVDVVDIRTWHYRSDGSLYGPAGGRNLAPRQHARLVPPGKTSFEQVYRAVREYRQRYPDKAIMFSADPSDDLAWAVFMAGGSLAGIPKIAATGFLASAASMQPMDLPGSPAGQWALGNARKEFIVYSRSSGSVTLNLGTTTDPVTIYWIDPKSGSLLGRQGFDGDTGSTELRSPASGAAVVWVTHSR